MSSLISLPERNVVPKQRYSMAQPTKPLFRHLPISRQTSFVKSSARRVSIASTSAFLISSNPYPSIEDWKDSWQFPCFFWISKTRKSLMVKLRGLEMTMRFG
jgi:hypothetical protein